MSFDFDFSKKYVALLFLWDWSEYKLTMPLIVEAIVLVFPAAFWIMGKKITFAVQVSVARPFQSKIKRFNPD